MIPKMLFRIVMLLIIFFSCQTQRETKKEISVFCASSLSPVLSQIKDDWEKDHDVKVVINAASSGTLARQIENGASADIYLSANTEWMQYLLKNTDVNALPKTFASNRLVLAAAQEFRMDSMSFQGMLKKLSGEQMMIAVADPKHAPLGKYTKESMEFFNVYSRLSDRLILCKDARSTLRLAVIGEAPLGFVYLSDALTSDRVRIVSLVPDESHRPMIYESVLLAKNNRTATEFYEFLTSDETTSFLERFGFEPSTNH